MGLLQEILAEKRARNVELAAAPLPSRPPSWQVRSAVDALRRPVGEALRLIAEIKLRSPSAGPLSRGLTPAARARAYERGGAAMVSVLTDSRWFDGSFEHLAEVRASSTVPLLCKDFVIDTPQVERAYAHGADAVLVIVRCLPGRELERIVGAVRQVGLEPFVEVVDEEELERALSVKARIIGVNARDLDTLTMDTERAARVLARIPSDTIAVHFSGVRTPADASRVGGSRADAALLGEALMRRDDPEVLLHALQQPA